MRIGVCDFPSAYAFPPHGYGGIERWLWAVAVGAKHLGADVWLLGPSWRTDLPNSFNRLPTRLEDTEVGDGDFATLDRLRLDLLVVGHEYPSLPRWRTTWIALGCDVATFQHDPNFRHAREAFDGKRSRLFCYSPEMVARYGAHRPLRTLSVQFGLGEEMPPTAKEGDDLVWLGRVDGQKAPHLAIQAAARLGRTIRIVGPVLDQAYAQRHRGDLQAPHVELVGELAGADKLDALRQAGVMVYTCARDYVEAGAAVFGESLRSGTPVAGLAWRVGTCAEVALCTETGALATVDPDGDDNGAVELLTDAIVTAERLRARDVQAIGLQRFDPAAHVRVLAGLSDG